MPADRCAASPAAEGCARDAAPSVETADGVLPGAGSVKLAAGAKAGR